MYNSHCSSFEDFCATNGQQAYPATTIQLLEWISVRTDGAPGFSRIKADSILQGLSAIKAAHHVRLLRTSQFEEPAIRIAIAGARRLQGTKQKKKAEPLSKQQLASITSAAPERTYPEEAPQLSAKELDSLNFNAAIKVAFAGFLRTSELTYEERDLQNQGIFQNTKLQRRDITFADDDEHAILLLRSSKSDHEHTGIELILAATDEPTCPVRALRALFILDPQPQKAPLFRTSKGAFSRNRYIGELQKRIRATGNTNYKLYTGHSTRRGAAQHAADNGILDNDIQKLGQWSSQAFRGYFHISQAYKYALNRRFQTGRSLPVVPTSPYTA